MAEPMRVHPTGERGVNRDKGQVVVTPAWETEAARAASDAPLVPIRGGGGRILGGQAHLEEFDLAVRELLQPAQPGYWSRATRLAVPAGRLEHVIDAFRGKVLPGLRTQEGFCGGVLLVDRRTGTALGLTTWASRAALERSRQAADQLRAGTADSAVPASWRWSSAKS